ncbi:endonuclease/exonuclease/phosphatase family protein [Niveispirillum sp. BGYR6]|uniref:endonuclease/exonuclease/phosphatase family protein n=1 Tax=Niveispirillum sp. BGYR6 TaxID=2971249 RepID=UPI0022B9C0A8|nr:endonuclease/exonuclease/phosphatase family protein [Niveispirillum sp. BGYR6]MDG5495066.1 endonuclease/exonuclease/phosphatase family protein [Niveispirillum sp. BGYR6]
MRHAFIACLWLAAAILSTVSLPLWGESSVAGLATLEHLRIGYLWLAAGILTVGLVFRRRLLALLAGLILALNLFYVLPSLYEDGGAPSGKTRFTLLHANLWHLNPTPEAIAAMLNREAPDLVSIVELTDPEAQRWQGRLGGFWPHRVYCENAGCGNMVLSRWPATLLEARSGWHDGPPFPNVLAARIEHPEGAFTIVVVHFSRPVEPETQRAQAIWLARWLPTLPQPVVVAGDFNAAPWSSTIKLVSESGYTRIAHTGPTWPSGPLIFTGIPIDHILGGTGVSAVNVRRLPPFGSDHLALLAQIALTPQAIGPAKPAGEGGGTAALVPTP